MSGHLIEFCATVLIGLAVVKIVVFSISASAWITIMRAVYARPMLTAAVSYVLAGFVLSMLLSSGLTIVEILAVGLFVVLLLVPGFAPYLNTVLQVVEGKTAYQILREQWLYTLVWMTLLGWGVWSLWPR